MIKAIAIDDEPLALTIIENHANRIPFLEITRQFTSALKALEFLRSESVDLIFLDINMPDISGIEFLKSLTTKPEIIMTTAYSEFAVESYELNVTDYLLKPFEFERFLTAVNKVKTVAANDAEPYIFIKSGYEHIRVELQHLKYIKAEGNYVAFYSDKEKILTRMKFADAEILLPSHTFIKVHRSFVINKNYVIKVEKHQVHIENETIPLSQTYYQNIITKL